MTSVHFEITHYAKVEKKVEIAVFFNIRLSNIPHVQEFNI